MVGLSHSACGFRMWTIGICDSPHHDDRPSLSGNSGHEVEAGADRPVENDSSRHWPWLTAESDEAAVGDGNAAGIAPYLFADYHEM
jgi:hypothetical protein